MAGGLTRTQSAHAAGVAGVPFGRWQQRHAPGLQPGPLAATYQSAHAAGAAGTSYADWHGTPTPPAPGPNRRVARAKSSGIRRSGRPVNPTVLNPTGNRFPIGTGASFSIAGVFFGAIAYALALSVADYGPTGPLLWFKAKFLNEAAPAPAAK